MPIVSLLLSLPLALLKYLLYTVGFFAIALALALVVAHRHRASIVPLLQSPRFASHRRRVAASILEWLIQQPVHLTDAVYTGETIVLLGIDVPNPDQHAWTNPSLLTLELLEVGLEGQHLAGLLALVGTISLNVFGVELKCGAERRLRRLRLHGLCLYPEETEGGASNTTLAYEKFYAEEPDAAPEIGGGGGGGGAEAEARMEGVAEEPAGPEPTEASELTSPLQTSSTLRSSLVGSSSLFMRGVREVVLREGLSWACGDALSRAFAHGYDAHERIQHRAGLADAQRTVRQHLAVGNVLVSSVTLVRASAPSSAPSSAVSSSGAASSAPSAALLDGTDASTAKPTRHRTLHVDGPVWELSEYEGPVGRLASLMVTGALSRLLRDQIKEARERSERRVRAAAQQAQLATSQATAMVASSSARAAYEVKEAALEAKEVVQASVQATAGQARAVVESGATFAKRQLYGSVVPGMVSMAKLGLVGWSDANSRLTASGYEAGKD